jgi:hypothetical protein
MMTRLPVFVVMAVLGGITYSAWPPPALPLAAVERDGMGELTPTARRVAVPFSVLVKVRQILEQQRKLAVATSGGDIRPAEVKIGLAVRDVRERLLRDGIHADAAVLEVVRVAAAEAGFNEQQTSVVVQAFQYHQQSGNEQGGKTADRVGRTIETFKALVDETRGQP